MKKKIGSVAALLLFAGCGPTASELALQERQQEQRREWQAVAEKVDSKQISPADGNNLIAQFNLQLETTRQQLAAQQTQARAAQQSAAAQEAAAQAQFQAAWNQMWQNMYPQQTPGYRPPVICNYASYGSGMGNITCY